MPVPRKESTDADASRTPMAADIEEQQQRRNNLEQNPVIAKQFKIIQEQFEPLGAYLFGATTVFYEFFHANGYLITRTAFDSRKTSAQLNAHLGWVYAFYGDSDEPIYVGETGRSFAERFSEHENQGWWTEWRRVKVLPCPQQGLRKYFESMLGIAGGYQANRAQPSDADDFFDQVLRSLLLLGSNLKNLPEAPIGNIHGQIQMVSDMLQCHAPNTGSIDAALHMKFNTPKK